MRVLNVFRINIVSRLLGTCVVSATSAIMPISVSPPEPKDKRLRSNGLRDNVDHERLTIRQWYNDKVGTPSLTRIDMHVNCLVYAKIVQLSSLLERQ